MLSQRWIRATLRAKYPYGEKKYGVFFCPYFSVFGLNTEISGKYRPEKTQYLDTFHAVRVIPTKHTCTSTHIKANMNFLVNINKSKVFCGFVHN